MPVQRDDDALDYEGSSLASEIERIIQELLSEALPGVPIYRRYSRPVATLTGDTIADLLGEPVRSDYYQSVHVYPPRAYATIAARLRDGGSDSEPVADPVEAGTDAAPASDGTETDS